jgi:hypothetical protein
MKTKFLKLLAVFTLLSLSASARAQVLLGSFQGAGDPLNAGWVNPNTGTAITSDSGMSFVSAGVSNYPQSLQITGTMGTFGSDSLQLQFSPAQIAAFNTNSWITFTISVPAWTNGGFSQIFNLAFNAPGYGYNNHPWTTMMATGNTNANSAGNGPNFFFFNGSPLQTQVVTVNYSDITNAIIAGGEGFLQMTFQGNQGGGAPAYIYMNSVVLSQTPFGAASGAGNSIVIDEFNPTNNAFAGTNIYADVANGQITNVYNLWTGYGGNDAVDPTNILWDPTQDAGGATNSGSLKIIANFTGANQYVLWDRGPNNTFALNPPITNGNSLLTMEFDIKYDPSSPTVVNGTVTNYGHFEIGVVPPYTSATDLGTFDYNVTNSGWVHVSVPLTPIGNDSLQSISGIFLKQYGGFYGPLNGTTTLWIDNLKLTFTNLPPAIPPPTVAIEKAKPGLRIFAGSIAGQFDREEVTSTGQGQSWIGGTYPVSYSFSLLSYPANIGQTHIFLLPVNALTAGNTPWGYNGVDYSFASNAVWLSLNPGPTADTVIANVLWKTNHTGANPDQTALTFTNTGVLGTWTLQFNSANSGVVVAPDAVQHPFTINDPGISTNFANPMVSYFGLQPNSTAGEGEYEDWGFISISNVADGNIMEDFTKEGADFSGSPLASPSGNFRSDISALPAGVVIVRTNLDRFWVNWTLPAINYSLGTATNLVSPTQWINPAFYSGYNDQVNPRGNASQFGPKMWALLPTDDLPTVDGNPGSPPAPTAFFTVSTNVLSP